MKRLVTLFTEGFADWETALLNGVARGFYGAETEFATPGGTPVTSMGGMRIIPNFAIEDTDLSRVDALVICGGRIWQSPLAPDLTNLVRDARTHGVLIAAICDGTLALARTGLLDTVRHTSNGKGYLDASGYGGAALYADVPHAVIEEKIVTAPATAPVTFMAEVLRGIGLADDRLDLYIGMHAAEHGGNAARTQAA
ncbi:MAG: glutamine amidotransferase [Hyphomicrobiales bacterium]|nr:glutamine amidotransferase [Hyphomicrobiales bacterium]